MSQNLNQFALAHAAGDLDLSYFGGENIVSALFDPTDDTNTLAAGTGVMLSDLGSDDPAGSNPVVAVRTADTDPIFGVKIRNTKAASVSGNAVTEIAAYGAVVYMIAKTALSRGAKVTLDRGTAGMVKTIGTGALFGILLDKAVNANDLVRVWVKADGMASLNLNDLIDGTPTNNDTLKYVSSTAKWTVVAVAD